MNEQMLTMLARMAGLSPEQLKAHVEGLATFVNTLGPTLTRIEANQTEILTLLKGKTDDNGSCGERVASQPAITGPVNGH